MIRKEVEKLRGLTFTPEEMEEVILPAVEAFKGKGKVKPGHSGFVTKNLLEQSYYKYIALYRNAQHTVNLYGRLADMAKNDPDRLLDIWDKILETGQLVCPKDIDEELLLAFDVMSRILVYGDLYEVSSITGSASNVVTFRKL